jgi:hypothetical protein
MKYIVLAAQGRATLGKPKAPIFFLLPVKILFFVVATGI